MLRKAPPLESVEIFVASARASSFRAVARALAISPSAVSRRIAGLEAFLGVTLFERSATTVQLSVAGRRYLDLVEAAIGTIRQATSVIARPDAKTLHIATSHSFASCWLIPRLADLRRQCGLEIDIIPSRDAATLRSGEASFGIWGGRGQIDGMTSDMLFDMKAIPVVAPCFLERQREPITEARLAQLTLLGVHSPAGLWERWFALGGVRPASLDIREFASLQMAYETAAAGSGATLAVPLLAEQLLDQRKLVPIGVPRRIGETYRLYRPERALTSVQHRFLAWLRETVATSVAQFDAICSPHRDLPRTHQRCGIAAGSSTTR